jgi:flavin-binding protein dodecin
MPGHVYKMIELVGTSGTSIDDAVQTAVTKAAETLRGLDWFQVSQIRGRIENGAVSEYQVDLKIGFRLMSHEELQA